MTWKYFEFETQGEWRLYRAKLDGREHANPVAGLIAEYRHKKHGWRKVNNLMKRDAIYKELKQYLETNTLNKPGFLGLMAEMMGDVL